MTKTNRVWILRSEYFADNPILGTFDTEEGARAVAELYGGKVEMSVWDGTITERTPERQKVIDEFHRLYYGPHDAMENCGLDQRECRFMGWAVIKCPLDLWVYQELIYELKPELIVETGSGGGGSAYYMACMMDLCCAPESRIVSIDIADWPIRRPNHPRVTFCICDSVDPELVRDIYQLVSKTRGHTLVILDSDHSKDHVLKELRCYAPIVTKDSYVIVEDGNVNGHPVMPDHGPGPWEAVEEFLRENKNFEIDPRREKYLLTLNPNGYLRRI